MQDESFIFIHYCKLINERTDEFDQFGCWLEVEDAPEEIRGQGEFNEPLNPVLMKITEKIMGRILTGINILKGFCKIFGGMCNINSHHTPPTPEVIFWSF